jgi:hypothetical protein
VSVQFKSLLAGVCLTVAIALPVSAATITDGFTFAVASGGGAPSTGTHFHSDTGGAYGNPAGKAEVGSYSSEEVRGLSEYNLTGLTSTPSAFVTFEVYKAGGLFGGTNDFPYNGLINVVAYAGNNLEDISDYSAASIGTVGQFSTTGLGVGNTISFDITSIFNAAIAAGDTSLGIRLEIASAPNGGAYTFDLFRLTTDNQSTVDLGGATPLPGALPLFASGLGAIGFLAHRRKRKPQAKA